MRHYLLDSKHDGDFDQWPGVIRQDKAPGMPGKRERYQVWQPMTIYPNEVETWLDRIFHNGPGIVMIDELYHLCYSRNEYSHNYDIIVKMGRSLKIGVITLTQELSKIPQNAFTQSDHRLGFYLEGRYNKMIRNDMLKFEVDQPKDQFGFWYQHKNGRGEPPYFRDIQSFLGVSGASR